MMLEHFRRDMKGLKGSRGHVVTEFVSTDLCMTRGRYVVGNAVCVVHLVESVHTAVVCNGIWAETFLLDANRRPVQEVKSARA